MGGVKTVTLVNLTYAILEVNGALDTGKFDSITVEEIEGEMEAGRILEFLKIRLGDAIDLGLLSTEARAEITSRLQDIQTAYAGKARKWFVRNRGLCLMIAWLNELVQQRAFED